MSDHSLNSETTKRSHEVELTTVELDAVAGGDMSVSDFILLGQAQNSANFQLFCQVTGRKPGVH